MIEYLLRTQATPFASRKLAKAAVTILTESVHDRDELFNFDLALSEACANVVRHAYSGMCAGEIEIRVCVEPGEYIAIEVSDWGQRFPNWPVDVKNAEPHAEGGRGLFIMSELADAFNIVCLDDKKTIHLKRFVKDTSWKHSALNANRSASSSPSRERSPSKSPTS